MQHPSPLIGGTLIKRYKRFLADVTLDNGQTVTATCPNTGSMMGLVEPGIRVWLSESNSPTRKYRHTWEMVELAKGNARVGINTGRPNRIVRDAIERGSVAELNGYGSIANEVKYGVNSRIDLLLKADDRPDCYVEVKNVTLSRSPGLAEFPDAVTARGAKHLDELANMVRAGARAVMFYLVQRDDCERFALAGNIDNTYLQAFARAREAGVEAVAYSCKLDLEQIALDKSLPFA